MISISCTLTSKTPFLTIVCVWIDIGLVDKCVHEQNREVDGHLVFHECPLSVTVVYFEADIRLSSIDEATAATREDLDEDQQTPSSSAL